MALLLIHFAHVPPFNSTDDDDYDNDNGVDVVKTEK